MAVASTSSAPLPREEVPKNFFQEDLAGWCHFHREEAGGSGISFSFFPRNNTRQNKDLLQVDATRRRRMRNAQHTTIASFFAFPTITIIPQRQ